MEFNGVYNLAVNKARSVDNFELVEKGGWSPRLRRNHNDRDWEFEDIVKLLGCLHRACPIPRVHDSWGWSLSSKGLFSTKSFYGGLINFQSGIFPQMSIWRPFIPSKVNFFMWTSFLAKILT